MSGVQYRLSIYLLRNMYHRYYPCKLCLEPGEKEDELQFHNTNYYKILLTISKTKTVKHLSFHQTICSIEYYFKSNNSISNKDKL